jgi:hypothetical protein
MQKMTATSMSHCHNQDLDYFLSPSNTLLSYTLVPGYYSNGFCYYKSEYAFGGDGFEICQWFCVYQYSALKKRTSVSLYGYITIDLSFCFFENIKFVSSF